MIKQNEEGQALIELIIFLPLMVTLYSVIGGFASGINGSINQQKATRAYYFYRAQNNSTTPGPKSFENFSVLKSLGMFHVGWKDKFVNGRQPLMPCYKISIPFKDKPADDCEESYTDPKTLWVRVGTVYGICGGTYVVQNNKVYPVPDGGGSTFNQLLDKSSCTNTQ